MVEQVKTKSEPRVRFRGFTDEWEQVKMGELLSYEQPTKYIVDSDNYDDSVITPVLTAGKSFLLGYTDEIDGVYDKGDVILFDDFTTATQLVNFEFKVKSSAMKLLTPIAENNINFLYETLNLIRYPHDDHKRYWISEYATLKVKTPSSLPEQQKIGELFQTLDNVIDLSNTQVENMKQQKKALLQRLFPQKGETEPKVRVRGLTDAWEEVKLGDVLQKEIKGKAQKSKLVDGEVEYLDANRLNGGEPFLSDNTIDVNHEDILVLWDGSKAGTVYTGFEGALGSTLKAYVVNDDNDSGFVYQWLSLNQDLIYERYRTPNIPHVIKNFTTAFLIYTPSLEEQQAIGELFQTLDEQISQAEDKVSQYKELKQALLQRLFV